MGLKRREFHSVGGWFLALAGSNLAISRGIGQGGTGNLASGCCMNGRKQDREENERTACGLL